MSRFNVGGTSQWLFQLSSGLTDEKIENLLVFGNCPVNEREDQRINEINHRRLKGLGPKTSLLLTCRTFFELRNVIKEFKPDIINTHTSKAGVLGRLAARSVRHKASMVHTYHGHVLSGYFNKSIEFAIKLIEKFLSLITDYYLVSGAQVLEDIKNVGIIRGSDVLTIWPAVPDYAIHDRNKLREKLGISPNEIVVGWLGRKVPIKRIDRILETAEQLSDIKFLIAGDGESIRETFPKFFTSDKAKNVIELGFSTPAEVWSISDIAILTSDNEAMPISPIEAALASVPVIAIDSGATREVMMDGITGILCPKDSSSIITATKNLARDEALRSKMGMAARKLAVSRFSPQSSIQRQLEGYQAALKAKHV
jgi:glycosyltransferase involved in cell wall biosynthesis